MLWAAIHGDLVVGWLVARLAGCLVGLLAARSDDCFVGSLERGGHGFGLLWVGLGSKVESGWRCMYMCGGVRVGGSAVLGVDG